MHRNSMSLSSWLLAGIAACLLLIDAGQVAFAARPVNVFELFMGGVTLAAGAVIAASAEPWWRD